MTHPWDEQRIAALESALERCMYDHANVCTETHKFRRERDALAAKLVALEALAARLSAVHNRTCSCAERISEVLKGTS